MKNTGGDTRDQKVLAQHETGQIVHLIAKQQVQIVLALVHQVGKLLLHRMGSWRCLITQTTFGCRLPVQTRPQGVDIRILQNALNQAQTVCREVLHTLFDTAGERRHGQHLRWVEPLCCAIAGLTMGGGFELRIVHDGLLAIGSVRVSLL